MRGFRILVNDVEEISGGITEGITGVMLTFKDGKFRVLFNSLNNTGMVSYTWYSSNLIEGDKVKIIYEDLIQEVDPISILDYNDQEAMNKMDLESYCRLKEELEKEGLL